jgi:hypothetical protein
MEFSDDEQEAAMKKAKKQKKNKCGYLDIILS